MHIARWIERGAWAVGLVLLGLYGAGRVGSEAARVRGLDALRQAEAPPVAAMAAPAEQPPAAALTRAPAPDSVDQSLWSKSRILAFAASITQPGIPEGALRIPSLQLEVPVYAGATELNLNRGAARIAGTAQLGASGNVGIAAHRDGFFRKLKDIGLGADVYLDVGGTSLRYRVTELRIVMPSDVHVLAATKVPSITLVTCYPFYFLGDAPQRYIVRAELADAASGISAAVEVSWRTKSRASPTQITNDGALL